MKSILDPSFRYTNSASTNLRKTFARIRREVRAADEKAKEQKAPANAVLSILNRRAAAGK